MTKDEIGRMVGYEDGCNLYSAIRAASEEMPSIKAKQGYDRIKEPVYTKEEVECICRNVRPELNELQIALVLENYKEHEKPFERKVSEWIDGTEKFEESARKDHKRRACVNCSYCCGKSRRNDPRHVYPYCKFYEKFVFNITVTFKHKAWTGEVKEYTRRADFLKDCCGSWVRGDVRKFKRGFLL